MSEANESPVIHVPPSGRASALKRAAKAIAESKKPILYVGGGAVTAGASAQLAELAVKNGIPVTMTLLGLGAFPMPHELALGMLGMHGTAYANHAIMDSDLIIAVGARFDDRVTGKVAAFAPHAKVVHIDIDPASVSKNVDVDIPIVGDAKTVLKQLNGAVKKPDTKDWLEQIAKWKKAYPLKYRADSALRPQYVIEQICEATKGEAIICTEVGQHQMWTAQFYRFAKPRTILSSGGLGTMGYGFPAAIGAQVGMPGATVIDIAGDGSIQMNIQEMMTAVCNKLPVKVVILNNGYLGMVRQWQELFYCRRYSETCMEAQPDFVKLAEAFGAAGFRVSEEKDVVPTLKKAFKLDKPVIVDVRVAREENVYPMVPAGASLTEMLLV